LQIDAHTDFVDGWDQKAKAEWQMIGNEFGILSTQPAGLNAKDEDAHNSVPRQCHLEFMEGIGIPVRERKMKGVLFREECDSLFG
jgi:hypothetical protein